MPSAVHSSALSENCNNYRSKCLWVKLWSIMRVENCTYLPIYMPSAVTGYIMGDIYDVFEWTR
jgi:hypothetical protein